MAGLLGRLRLPAQNGLVQVQRVKVKSRSRLGTIFLHASFAAFFLFVPLPQRLLPSEGQKMLQKYQRQPDSEYGEFWQKEHERLQQLNQEAGNTQSTAIPGKTSASSDAPKAALFIPMTWLRKRKPEYYSASDPEWQAFVGLNEAKQQELKLRLSNMVCESLINDPRATSITGKPLKVNAQWLDFSFPLAAPIEYERSGLLWTDNKFIWTTRRYDPRQTKRLNRVLFPTAIFSSLQALSSKFLTSHYQSLKSRWSRVGSPNQQTSADESVPGPTTLKRLDKPKSESTLGSQKPSKTPYQTLSSSAIINAQNELIRNMMPEAKAESPISAAAKEFKLDFLKKWRQSQVYYPRGACLVRGEVGMIGPNGRWKVHVSAVYVPLEDTFVQILSTSIYLQPHKQAPVGKVKPGTPRKT